MKRYGFKTGYTVKSDPDNKGVYNVDMSYEPIGGKKSRKHFSIDSSDDTTLSSVKRDINERLKELNRQYGGYFEVTKGQKKYSLNAGNGIDAIDDKHRECSCRKDNEQQDKSIDEINALKAERDKLEDDLASLKIDNHILEKRVSDLQNQLDTSKPWAEIDQVRELYLKHLREFKKTIDAIESNLEDQY